MIKLKDLIDEKQYIDNAKNRALDRVGAEWGAEKGDGKKKDKKSKEDKPKTPGLGGGWDKQTGPKSAKDAVGDPGDHKKESAIVQGIKQMADKNRDRDFGDQEKTIEVDGEETSNLCDVEVPGTNMFCGDNKGIPRAKMPQLKSKPWGKGEGEPWVHNDETGKYEPTKFEETDDKYAERVPSSTLPKDEKGEVNTEDLFKSKLGELGIEMSEPTPMNVGDLKATQNELKPANVAFMVDVLMTATPPPHNTGDPDKDKEELDKWKLSESLREPIIVSKDGYILDGHHRWAALVALDIANGGSGDIEMMVKEVDAGAEELVEKTNEFTKDQGLQTKPAEKKKEEVVQPFAELYYRMKK